MLNTQVFDPGDVESMLELHYPTQPPWHACFNSHFHLKCKIIVVVSPSEFYRQA